MPTIRFTVNGTQHSVDTEPERPLVEVLREDLGLTGTKFGCGEGQCGACTVLLDNQAVFSCITPVRAAEGRQVTTIEGLATAGKLHYVQQAFLQEGAMQCGYCTAGMIVRTVALLESNPIPTDDEVIAGLNTNLCRCNGYHRIMAAVRSAVRAANPNR